MPVERISTLWIAVCLSLSVACGAGNLEEGIAVASHENALTLSVNATVDASANNRSINPMVYGMAFREYNGPGTAAEYMRDVRLPVSRWGGNDVSRYNWELGDASSAARDWNWANKTIGFSSTTPGGSADQWISLNKSVNAASMISVPMMGWVANSRNNADQSTGVPGDGGLANNNFGPDGINNYNPASNQSRTSIRSLVRKGSALVDSPNLTDGVVYQDEWINHLTKTHGAASNGGVPIYIFDNEYDLWHHTHTDVAPRAIGYDDLLARYQQFASMVKSMDPTAQTSGPASWGWLAYQRSPKDQFSGDQDKAAHGGQPLLAWFLDKMRQYDTTNGKRTLDYLDVHYYPQGTNLLFPGGTDAATNALRLRQVRVLWDPNYKDESWQNDTNGGAPLKVIPSLRAWIDTYYPGTKLAITEWNWGAETHINGGLAVAEVLGVFGREGVDAATYWDYPDKNSPAYLAYKLYRNADGAGAGFAATSVKASSDNDSMLGIYAAKDGTSRMTLMLVNRDPANSMSVTTSLQGFTASGTANVYTVTGAAPGAIASSTVTPAGSSVSLTVAPASMTLVVLSGAGSQPPPVQTAPAAPTGLTATASSGKVSLSFTASSNATGYFVYRCTSAKGTYTKLNGGLAITGTSYSDTTVVNGTPYWYRVTAMNAAGTSAASNTASATPQATTTPPPTGTGTSSALFTDALANGWQNWSWATTDFANASPVYAGSRSIKVTYAPRTPLYFAHNGRSTVGMTHLEFRINAGTNNNPVLRAKVRVAAVEQPDVAIATYCGGSLPANTWVLCRIPLSALNGVDKTLDGIFVVEGAGLSLAPLYVDDVMLTGSTTTTPTAPAVPTGLSGTGATNRANLSWTASSGATGYNVFRSTSATGTFTKLTSTAVSATTYADSAATAGTTLWYRVSAVNAVGESAQSSAVSVQIPAATVTPSYLYRDGLTNSWVDWSWGVHSLTQTAVVFAGTTAISANLAAWEGLYLHHTGFNTSGRTHFEFRLHGGATGGQRLTVKAVIAGAWTAGTALSGYCTATANAWVQCRVPLSAIGAANTTVEGLSIQEGAGVTAPVFYVDDISVN